MTKRALVLMLSLALLLGLAFQGASAAGTAAGTAITNQVQVNYTAGSNSRTTNSNAITLYVAHYVTGAYSPTSRTQSGLDRQTVYFATRFTNTGNRADNFTISFNSNAGYTVAMIEDQNHNGVYDSGEPVITTTGSMGADAYIDLLVRVQIDSGRTNGETVVIRDTLTSTAVNDNGNNIVVANPGAQFTFAITYTVARPVIVFTATQSTVTTNASRIPGADVTYTMTLDNTGTVDVSGTSTVTFVLDPHFRYVSSTHSGALSGADGNGNGGTVTWTLTAAELAVAHAPVAFDAVVEPEQVTNSATGVASGTTVYAMTTSQSTQTKIVFSDGLNTYNQDNANSFNFNVGTASGVVITQVTPNSSGNATETVSYRYSLKNLGNHTDGFQFSQANGTGSNHDVAHVFSSDSAGAAITEVTGVTQGQTVTFWARVIIPANAANGDIIVRNLTSTTETSTPDPPTGGAINSTDEVTTTVAAPVVSVVLSGGGTDIISGGVNGNVVPGTVMRWTVVITNAGQGVATNVSSSNLNAHTGTNLVVPGQFELDADGNGSYEITGVGSGYNQNGITINVDGSGVATVTFSSIPASAYRGYRYRVAVQ